MESFDKIITREDTTKYFFKIGKSTLYKMARKGKIPAVKIEYRENSKFKNLSVVKKPT
ncbi:hypothetical protein J7L87_01240 [bacterium]|nr:hypothetical protein [bacterium]